MIVAGFRTRDEVNRVAALLRRDGLGEVETYTPAEPSEQGAPASVSPIPLVMFLVGAAAAGFFFWLQVYATTTGYRIDVGGRPDDSWPAYVTNAFEFGVLMAMLTGFAAFLIANRMPSLYDPIDECDGLRQASRDAWFLSVTPPDDGRGARARDVLARSRPVVMEELAG